MSIRALIFDFDGLILDTESPLLSSWTEIFTQYGLIVSEVEWASLLGAAADPPEAYALLEAHVGKPLDRVRLHDQRVARELELLTSEQVLSGVRELISSAQRAGLKLAVASSSDHAWVDGLLKQHELIDAFDAIVCAEDVVQTKPSPDLFLDALHRLGIRADEALAFEDSQHGLKAAKQAGIFCVVVPNQVTRCLSFDGADLVASSIDEYTLEQYLKIAGRD